MLAPIEDALRQPRRRLRPADRDPAPCASASSGRPCRCLTGRKAARHLNLTADTAIHYDPWCGTRA